MIYYGFYRHRARPAKRAGGFSPADATIIRPTVQPKRGLIDALKSWLANHPREIMVVTTIPWLTSVKELIQKVNDARIITLHTIGGRGKRPALVKGIQQARIPVVALVDDHIAWSLNTLNGLLNSLSESRDVGGVTPIKNNKDPQMTALRAIAATRLNRSNVANATMAYFANGQVIVCSGKTSAYRTEILQDPSFLDHFNRDLWMNKYPLVSGDDVAITYWLYRNGWRTGFVSQDRMCHYCPTGSR